MPAGSRLVCTGAFDNSAKNPHNPEPKARARWGPQSWNEMFMGFADVAEAATIGDAARKAEPAGARSLPTGRDRGEAASNVTREAR